MSCFRLTHLVPFINPWVLTAQMSSVRAVLMFKSVCIHNTLHKQFLGTILTSLLRLAKSKRGTQQGNKTS